MLNFKKKREREIKWQYRKEAQLHELIQKSHRWDREIRTLNQEIESLNDRINAMRIEQERREREAAIRQEERQKFRGYYISANGDAICNTEPKVIHTNLTSEQCQQELGKNMRRPDTL